MRPTLGQLIHKIGLVNSKKIPYFHREFCLALCLFCYLKWLDLTEKKTLKQFNYFRFQHKIFFENIKRDKHNIVLHFFPNTIIVKNCKGMLLQTAHLLTAIFVLFHTYSSECQKIPNSFCFPNTLVFFLLY